MVKMVHRKHSTHGTSDKLLCFEHCQCYSNTLYTSERYLCLYDDFPRYLTNKFPQSQLNTAAEDRLIAHCY